jgi:putative ABC transport system permease protein
MLRHLFQAVRNLFRRHAVERDLGEEIASYEDLLVDEHLAAGESPEAARRASRLTLGGAESVKDAVRDVRAGARVEQLGHDVRYAFRTLGRSRGFTAFTLLTFAVAIGGLTVIFSLVNAVLLKPLPYPRSDRLVMVLQASVQHPVGGYVVSAPNYLDWERQNDVFERMALYEYQGYNLSDAGEPEEVGGLRVTGGVFDLLRVAPLLGRGLLPADDSGHRVVVLSYRLWRRRYGADSALVGRNIRLNHHTWQVVGVMPPGFAFPSAQQELWIPIQLTAQDRERGAHSFFSIARLRDGVTLVRARSELRTIGDRLAAQYPTANAGEIVNVFPMRDLWIEDVHDLFLTLLAAVALVLVIASANIASLLVARHAVRRREIAARMALGGSRNRIVQQLVTESVMLALGGALLGLGLAVFGIRALVALFPPGLRNVPFRDLSSVSPDATVFAVAALVALVAGVLAGLVPALVALPAAPAEVLREGDARSGTDRRGRRLKSWLVGLEVAMAVVVLVGAGLLVASIRRLQRVAPGLDPANVAIVQMALPQADYYGPAERTAFCSDVAREVGAVPGVVSVSAVSHIPLSGSNAGRSFVLEGAPDPGPENLPDASYGVVCPGYFRTMRIPLLAGRDFTAHDRADAPPVMIINQRLAARWFPNADPVGRRFKLGQFDSPTPWVTIIGVAGDVRHWGLDQAPEPYFYATYPQAAWPYMSILVRTRGAPAAMVGPVRAALRRAAPGEAIGDDETMAQVLEGSLGHLRFPMVLFSVFAMMAVALTVLGCFGIASQAVVQRRRELGIRIALGARTAQVYGLVVGQVMRPVAWGLIGGIAGALAFTRVLRGMLYDISPGDPATLALGATILAVVTIGASIFPARRATRVNPASVLRDD